MCGIVYWISYFAGKMVRWRPPPGNDRSTSPVPIQDATSGILTKEEGFHCVDVSTSPPARRSCESAYLMEKDGPSARVRCSHGQVSSRRLGYKVVEPSQASEGPEYDRLVRARLAPHKARIRHVSTAGRLSYLMYSRDRLGLVWFKKKLPSLLPTTYYLTVQCGNWSSELCISIWCRCAPALIHVYPNTV